MPQNQMGTKSEQEYHPKIDALRLENQRLRIELEKFHDSNRLFRELSKIYRNKISSFLEAVKSKTINRSNNFYENNFDAGFKPYQVRPLHSAHNNRKRVLHVVGNFWTGGSARLVVDIIEHLGHIYEQEVVTRDIPERPAYVGLTIHQCKELVESRPILSILNSFKPDFLHIHYLGNHNNEWSELDWKWYNNVFQAAKKHGCKIIENINIPTDPYVCDAVKYYVYVSDYVKREFSYPDARNVVIYPGSNFKLFNRSDEYPLSDDCIGMVYRLDGDKINENAIDVFIDVVQRRSETKALIVGGGSLLEVYRNAVRKAGVSDAFTFTGYVSYEELPALYKRMSVFVAPVRRESFGQVTPFAMNMEIPVVAYRVGALPEIVDDEELLAPPGDSHKLSDIVIGLLDNGERRFQIGTKNRRRAKQLFSVETMIDGYRTLYDELTEPD